MASSGTDMSTSSILRAMPRRRKPMPGHRQSRITVGAGSMPYCTWAPSDLLTMPCARLSERSADMKSVESPREAALRRITEQEARIARQKQLIANLTANGTGSAPAQRLVANMEDTLKSATRESQPLSKLRTL